MTLAEFKRSLPGLIDHINWGIQYLETKQVGKGVMACYRGIDNLSSFGTYGANWQEVFEKLQAALKESTLS